MNVRLARPVDLDAAPGCRTRSVRSRPSSATAAAIMVRPSGTEPVVRIMVEAPTEAEATAAAARVKTALEA